MLDRRLFLGAGIAGASALTFSSVWSQSAPNFGLPDLPALNPDDPKFGIGKAKAEIANGNGPHK